MPVPPKRRSASKGRRGRAHQALVPIQLIKCKNCGKPTRPHHVCPSCGMYNGREVIKLKVKKNKKGK